ncbi:DUF11 domain-containing protein [Stratiformator vulcanicus]|uniref:Uncharacterized protein n=1 Tax=Stratiformator vulcanicus TaxID=2527980 RepID=A0A517QZI8_9PLAN|nr:DUF11 domain-containing protein [Stratiformator vulcanicus]QDT37013.1 hypothetical protein Pan189_13790 [Stratiformator vulcanicus]
MKTTQLTIGRRKLKMTSPSLLLAAAMLCGLCSCASISQSVNQPKSDFSLRDDVSYGGGNLPVESSQVKVVEEYRHRQVEEAGVTRISSPRVEKQSDIQLTSGHEFATTGSQRSSDIAVSFRPAERREAIAPVGQSNDWCPPGMTGAANGLVCPPGAGANAVGGRCGPYGAAGAVCIPGGPGSDEYLCDGGDRALPIHFDDDGLGGLDTEDTVAQYRDLTGKIRFTESNRVCVYAPRFGEVRSISGAAGGHIVESAGEAETSDGIIALAQGDRLDTKIQRDRLADVRLRERAGGIESQSGLAGLERNESLLEHVKLINLYQELTFVRIGQIQRDEMPVLSQAMHAAVTWSRNQNPIATASVAGANEVAVLFREAEIVGIEEGRDPGVMRVVKLADREFAQPGDVITFTIRIDNTGGRPLTDVKLVDNLTPRLEYIPDSGTSDVAASLDVAPNGEGSQILTFTFDEPMTPKDGAIISFKTRVH